MQHADGMAMGALPVDSSFVNCRASVYNAQVRLAREPEFLPSQSSLSRCGRVRL